MQFVCLFVCLFVYLFIYLFIYLFVCLFVCLFACLFVCTITHRTIRLIVRSWLDVPNFATSRLHTCHHARAPSGGRWNCGRETFGNFAEIMTFRNLLHAVKLRHGKDGFASPPKEGVLRIFSP